MTAYKSMSLRRFRVNGPRDCLYKGMSFRSCTAPQLRGPAGLGCAAPGSTYVGVVWHCGPQVRGPAGLGDIFQLGFAWPHSCAAPPVSGALQLGLRIRVFHSGVCVAPQLRSLAGARPARLHTRNALKAIWPFFTSLKGGSKIDFWIIWFSGSRTRGPVPRATKTKTNKLGGGIPGPGAQGFQDNGVRKTRHTLTNWLAVQIHG